MEEDNKNNDNKKKDERLINKKADFNNRLFYKLFRSILFS